MWNWCGRYMIDKYVSSICVSGIDVGRICVGGIEVVYVWVVDDWWYMRRRNKNETG